MNPKPMVLGAACVMTLMLAGCSSSPTASAQPAASQPAVTAATLPSDLTVRCGPLVGDPGTCFAVLAAAGGSAGGGIRSITVTAGSTHTWCAPPDPCVSPPADGYWVTSETPSGSLKVPVYLGETGWIAGIPPAPQSTDSPTGSPTT